MTLCNLLISKNLEYVDKVKEISGVVVFKNFEGGFWGIEADDNYLPIVFPEQLKLDGAQLSCTVQIDDDAMSAISWGQPCTIISFSTLDMI